MEVTPDRAGYVEAQERLRRVLGESVILLQPASRTYPMGTPLDPETGEPYDPLVKPTASAQASAVVQARVAFRGGKVDSVEASPAGYFEDADAVVICSSAAASAASGATGMVIRDERYEIRTSRLDGIAGVDRFLIFGAKDPV